MTLRDEKKRLRAAALTERRAGDPVTRVRDSEKICELLLTQPFFRQCTCLLAYFAAPDEVNLLPAIRKAIAQGKRVAYPRCQGRGVMDFYFAAPETLTPGMYGIPEPQDGALRCIPDETALLLAPGVLFDGEGGRLGRGGGYYDRYLAQFPGLTVGISQNKFVVSSALPRASTDRPCDFLITEEGIRQWAKKPR